MRVLAATVRRPQQCQHQRVAAPARVRQRAAVSVLLSTPAALTCLPIIVLPQQKRPAAIQTAMQQPRGQSADARLGDAAAVLVKALGALPVDAERAGPAGGQRAAVLHTAHEARDHDTALGRRLLVAARPRAVVRGSPMHRVARGARVLQGDRARGAVGVSLHPWVCVIHSEQAVHLRQSMILTV